MFDALSQIFFLPSHDLFASTHNAKCKEFFSRYPEINSSGEDAFGFAWPKFAAYAFPPFNLVGRVLAKVAGDGVQDFLLICPN